MRGNPKPVALTEIEIQALLRALDGARGLDEVGAADDTAALVRAKRALRRSILQGAAETIPPHDDG